MTELFIDKTIEIDAPSAKVWGVLTRSEYTDQWTGEFSSGMRVESDWQLGSPVDWKGTDGKVMVEGNVTKVDPGKFLRFTMFDVEMGRYDVTEQDGLTFELAGHSGKTKLSLRHGDFAGLAEGQKYYDMTLESWSKILPKIKELAEK